MKRIGYAMATLLILSGILGADYRETEDRATEPKSYDNAKVVRIKYIAGEGFVQRSYDEGSEEATVNLPVFENDQVGTTDGRLEIYLGRSNYLRLDNDTRLQLEKVPELRKTTLTLKIESGALYLDITELDYERDIEVQTPDCGVFLLDKGSYRINVGKNSGTEVVVHDGIAEVAGRQSSRNVRENQKIVMEQGEVNERPYYFYSSERDDFDAWNDERNRELNTARYGSSRYLQEGYEDYEYELSRSGRWVYMDDFYSYVWMPYTLDAAWRPYWNGRWVWNPYYGRVWTSYDPWGWFTHSYGRWHWDPFYGWYWIPGYHWSPAWVYWFADDYYWGWCPLSWWNRPIIIINNHWFNNYNYRHGIPFHCSSSIIIHKNQLAAPRINAVALKNRELTALRGKTISFRGNAGAEKFEHAKVSVMNARGLAVEYKQGGLVTENRYRTAEAGAKKQEKFAADRLAPYSSRQGDVSGRYRSRSGDKSTSGQFNRSGDRERTPYKSHYGDETGGKAGSTSTKAGNIPEKKKRDESSSPRYVPQSEKTSGEKGEKTAANHRSATSSSRYYASSRSRGTLSILGSRDQGAGGDETTATRPKSYNSYPSYGSRSNQGQKADRRVYRNDSSPYQRRSYGDTSSASSRQRYYQQTPQSNYQRSIPESRGSSFSSRSFSPSSNASRSRSNSTTTHRSSSPSFSRSSAPSRSSSSSSSSSHKKR